MIFKGPQKQLDKHELMLLLAVKWELGSTPTSWVCFPLISIRSLACSPDHPQTPQHILGF